jgi:hypothetical protein
MEVRLQRDDAQVGRSKSQVQRLLVNPAIA